MEDAEESEGGVQKKGARRPTRSIIDAGFAHDLSCLVKVPLPRQEFKDWDDWNAYYKE